MLIHSVFFWLREDLSAEQRADFRAGVETLQGIEGASVYVGTPAATGQRPIIDSSYDIGLTVIVPDVAGHDAYQEHPLHLAFVEKYKGYWSKIVIYDAE